jgi:3-deoxy-manno-octulosonate cytidylyltransferase (CMP-KDO synthetase)
MSLIVIPARWESKRLPGKPLIKIGGEELILRVINKCCKSIADKVVVITDNNEIYNICKKTEIIEVIIDKTEVACGTDRVARVINRYDDKIVLNVQCDEPFLPTELLNIIIEYLNNNSGKYIVTPYVEINEIEAKNPNSVKVVLDKNNFALYFSRASIPFVTDNSYKVYNKHLAVYGFHRDTLIAFSLLKVGDLESKERLEQLRALENNIPIKMLKWYNNIISINVLSDVKMAEKYLKGVGTYG